MTPPTVSMPRVRGVTSNLGFEGPGMPVTGVEMLRKCQKKTDEGHELQNCEGLVDRIGYGRLDFMKIYDDLFKV